MRRYFTFAILILTAFISAGAFTITVLSDSKPLEGAVVTGYTQQMDSITSVTTNIDGIASIDNPNVEIIKISASGLASKLIQKADIKDGEVDLSPSVNLEEVQVVASNKTSFLTHDSYRISLTDMQKYPTVFQALSEIPFIDVLPNGQLYYLGNENIAILLNGVASDRQEISLLAKEDILKVDVYRNPPPRFASIGVVSVIDIITKSSLTGGNAAVNIDQAPYPLWGENDAALFYNYKRNRFSVTLNNSNKHFRKYRKNSMLSYEFDGIEYSKVKNGHDSHNDQDYNEIKLRYQNNLKDSYLYNIQLGGSINNSKSKLRQAVITNNMDLFANNLLSYKSDNWYVGNYFEKQLGDKGAKGTVMANIKYTHYGTDYHSSYSEYLPNEMTIPVEDHYNKYRINYNSVLGEIVYDIPEKKWGALNFAVFGYVKDHKYSDVGISFTQKVSELGGVATYYGWIRNVYAYVSAGGGYLRQSDIHSDSSYSDFMPRINVTLYYYLTENIFTSVSYAYNYHSPSPSQLSETNQWLDNHLTFHGNPNLKPYGDHSLKIEAGYEHRYVNANLYLGYNSAPRRICSQYYLTDEFILETMENLKKYRNPYLQLSATVFPLGSKKWSFFNRIIYGRIIGEGAGYSWNESRFQWNSSMSLMIRNWTLSASYQYPGKIADGQLVMPRGEYWDFGATYKVNDDLFIGAEIGMPFGNALKESEYSVGTDLISQNTETVAGDWANCVKIKLSWNISFGKNQNRKRPKYDNVESDNGVLKK